MKKKKRPRGRPELPWEYWNDLRGYHHMAGHMLPGVAAGHIMLGQFGEGPTEFSPEFLEYLRTLFRRPPKKYQYSRKFTQGLSLACQKIIKDGPLRWVSNGKLIAEISDWKTLRVRITEATQCPRPEPQPPMITELWQGNKLLRGKHQKPDWERFIEAIEAIDWSKAKWGRQVW